MTTKAIQLTDYMTEKELQDTIIEAAQVLGWKVHAERPAWTNNGYRTPIQGDKGYLDLTMVNPETKQVIFAELKSESGKVTEDQEDWLLALGQCPGVETYLWKPSDLDRILKILDGE